MSGPPDLVLAGNLLVDDIVRADGTTLMGEAGGAVLHAALAASLWGCRVGILSVAGSDYPAAALETLASRGVDLAGVRRLGRPGGRAWLLHEPTARRVLHHLDSPGHAAVSPTPADLPSGWRAARGIHLAPMPLERQVELARSLAETAPDVRPFVSLDPFEIVRDENAARWREPLAHVDALFAGEDDLRLTGPAAERLGERAGDRLRLLVLKQADRGGMLLDRHVAASHRWEARATDVVDVTGAGDAFAGGFLAAWLATGDAVRSLAQGVVSASLVLEDWGSRGLARATPAQARDRLAEWFPGLANRSAQEAVAR